MIKKFINWNRNILLQSRLIDIGGSPTKQMLKYRHTFNIRSIAKIHFTKINVKYQLREIDSNIVGILMPAWINADNRSAIVADFPDDFIFDWVL